MAQALTPLAFAQRHLGQRLTAPGGLGGQCVDLVNVWLVESRNVTPIHRNAVNWAGVKLPGLNWIANTPTNVPPRGAIVVWGPAASIGVGEFGHIALALTADGMNLCSLDQNWGVELVTLELHRYIG